MKNCKNCQNCKIVQEIESVKLVCIPRSQFSIFEVVEETANYCNWFLVVKPVAIGLSLLPQLKKLF